MTRKKHINNFLAPTQSRDNPANVCLCLCVFSFSEGGGVLAFLFLLPLSFPVLQLLHMFLDIPYAIITG